MEKVPPEGKFVEEEEQRKVKEELYKEVCLTCHPLSHVPPLYLSLSISLSEGYHPV